MNARIWLVALVCTMAAACASSKQRPAKAETDTVTAEDIARNPTVPIEKLLERKVTGVIVTRAPDGSLALQIRGGGSIKGDNEPLYIVDDLPFDPGPGGALTGIDPYNIESIKVLKGAEAAIYGIRGVNGVIIIKLKKPGQ